MERGGNVKEKGGNRREAGEREKKKAELAPRAHAGGGGKEAWLGALAIAAPSGAAAGKPKSTRFSPKNSNKKNHETRTRNKRHGGQYQHVCTELCMPSCFFFFFLLLRFNASRTFVSVPLSPARVLNRNSARGQNARSVYAFSI